MTDSEFNSSPRPSYDAFHLPSKYTFLKFLGEGSFGTVLKCWKKDAKETVAVKIPKSSECLNREIAMLKKFKRLKLEQHNIIKFLCCFNTSHGRALVFEMLDMSMRNYMVKTNCAPMRLSDVSTIIQQLAKALKALKGIGVIHTDLKFNNIMLVDHRTRPFQVKLIGVILVRPAAAKNVLQTEDEDGSISLEAEPKKKKKKKKKKKNCVQRFFSWMRKTFCCSITIKRI
ncbi:hypothetical protein ABVT39_009822 [Epinephelus coioides]